MVFHKSIIFSLNVLNRNVIISIFSVAPYQCVMVHKQTSCNDGFLFSSNWNVPLTSWWTTPSWAEHTPTGAMGRPSSRLSWRPRRRGPEVRKVRVRKEGELMYVLFPCLRWWLASREVFEESLPQSGELFKRLVWNEALTHTHFSLVLRILCIHPSSCWLLNSSLPSSPPPTLPPLYPSSSLFPSFPLARRCVSMVIYHKHICI